MSRTLAGVYSGKVVGNVDPEHRNRIKVEVPGIIAGGTLPWARLMVFGVGQGQGQLKIPKVGTSVAVMFEQGSPSFPIVVGEWLTTDGDIRNSAEESYVAGDSLKVTEGNDTQHVGGSRSVTANGDVELSIQGKSSVTARQINRTTEGSYTLTAAKKDEIVKGDASTCIAGIAKLMYLKALAIGAGDDVCAGIQGNTEVKSLGEIDVKAIADKIQLAATDPTGAIDLAKLVIDELGTIGLTATTISLAAATISIIATASLITLDAGDGTLQLRANENGGKIEAVSDGVINLSAAGGPTSGVATQNSLSPHASTLHTALLALKVIYDAAPGTPATFLNLSALIAPFITYFSTLSGAGAYSSKVKGS